MNGFLAEAVRTSSDRAENRFFCWHVAAFASNGAGWIREVLFSRGNEKGAAACFVVMRSLLGSVWTLTAREKNKYTDSVTKNAEDLWKRMEEFETAFHKVAQVMFYSPTPYLRLDPGDKIVDLSASYCTQLARLGQPERCPS